MQRDTAFTMDTSSIKYGPGVSREVGHDMSQWGVRRVLVVTDPYLAGGAAVAGVLEGLRRAGIDAVVFGPGDVGQAHAADEFVTIADLETARATFAQVFG